MTLERIGATELLHQRRHKLCGRVLELGAGDDPYCDLHAEPAVTVDIRSESKPDVVADAHALPFRSGAFDSALASQVFEHLHTPWAATKELRRVVRPGKGSILVAVPFLYWLHEEPHDYYRFTTYGLRKLLEEEFQVDEILSYGGRVAATVDLLFTATPSSTRVRRALRRLRKAVLGAPNGKRRPLIARLLLMRSAGEHPLGYLAVARPLQDDGTRVLPTQS